MNTFYKTWKYSGGEVGVRLENSEFNGLFRIQNSDDLVSMLMAINAYKHDTSKPVDHVLIPYLPYARQDRVVTKGDPLAIEVLAEIIASAGISNVISIDVHSEKSVPIFKDKGIKLTSISPVKSIEKYLRKNGLIPNKIAFIAPDAGARHKTETYCRVLKVDRAIQCVKKRNPDTGALTGFAVSEDCSASVEGLKRDGIKDLVIVDDICDGGGTFLGVADAIHTYYGNDFGLHLWTTHGIYSKGLDILLEKFDTLGCTNSFINNLIHEKLTTIEI